MRAHGILRVSLLALGVGLAVAVPLRDATRATSDPTGPDLAAFVHPLAGTESGGVFPGASTPFGMVQYSPNTVKAGGGGYKYSHPVTWGFGTTHLSGPGCPAMGDVVSLPTTGAIRTVDATKETTPFSHATEQASPGYYAATLSRWNVRAELSATTRTGWARFTFPATKNADVIIDPGANFRGVETASVHVTGNDTVVGSVSSWGYWNACPARSHNRYTLYFAMKFSRPFTSFGTGDDDDHPRPGHRDSKGRDAGAYVSFDATSDRSPVVSKVGISYVDAAGARRNLDAETGQSFDFDATAAAARSAWNGLLGRVQVSGGSAQHEQTFYTALYRTLLHPNMFSDVDGRFEGFDDRVHRTPSGMPQYTNFSMWDTYRSAIEVIDLVAPERVPDMVHSLLEDESESGWMPKWVYAHYDTNEMVGDPATNVIADAYLKGLVRPGDVQRAYAALLHNATDIPDSRRSPVEGRTGLEDYLNRGFVPYYGGRGDYTFSASVNLEYAVNDCALALMAGRLGEQGDKRYLLRRAKRYRYTIDPRLHFARARRANGSWKAPFDADSRSGFKEMSAWQYTWLAPQDVAGLTAALGGRAATLAKLDRFVDYPRVAASAATIKSVWRGNDRYNPRNEGDLQTPYLYDYLGEPTKTEDLVRAAETLYTTAPNGLPGGDDLGTMSGWYVLSALGLYPIMGGDDHYALTTPMFDHAVIGGKIVIDAPGASSGLAHIASATLNGAPLSTSQVQHGALAGGAHLAFALTNGSTGWATGGQTPSSACAANPATPDVRLSIRQMRSASRSVRLRVAVRNAGDAPASGLHVRMRLPGGWHADHRSLALASLAAGRSASQTWTLRARPGRVSSLRADMWWGAGRALRSFATTTARAPRR
ncbi:MAG TPA: GH92 family glycosyl hydrolase [Thermoleophilaceae bacterium]